MLVQKKSSKIIVKYNENKLQKCLSGVLSHVALLLAWNTIVWWEGLSLVPRWNGLQASGMLGNQLIRRQICMSAIGEYKQGAQSRKRKKVA